MFPLAALLFLIPPKQTPEAIPPAGAVVVVTATQMPTRLADTPASVIVLSGDELANSGAGSTDDALRQVPGFTLFRRSGSRTANPTSQGVSLRGIGASGASRALVLDDGVPLNDPFGGWVYWGRIPRVAIERVEVVRGGASDLYGSAAMGGVVQFLRRASRTDDVRGDLSVGSQRTASGSFDGSLVREGWSGTLSADRFTTAGSVLIDPAARGAVDRPTNSQHDVVDATLRHSGSEAPDVFLRLSRYAEVRSNGTAVQTNETEIRSLAAGLDTRAAAGSLMARLSGSDQDYHQRFSAIATDRSSERLTVDQSVPSRAGGGSFQWYAPLGGRQVLLAGGDLRQVEGASEEQQFALNGSVAALRVFGRQRTSAVYLEDVATIHPRISLTAGVRLDDWRNFDAQRNGAALSDRHEQAFSPRVTLLFRPSSRIVLTAAAYRAFRAPTLNELIRSFRVGNVVTEANENLGAEHLTAFEAGLRSGPLRLTLFSMTTSDTIANVTVATTPALITRQRRNAGSSRSRGLELDGEQRFGRWRLSGGALLADSRVISGELAGRRLPQVPRLQATLQSSWDLGALSVGVQMRWSGRQFDDDLNQFPLRSFFAADFFASMPLHAGLSATLAVENLFDRRIETAATPSITLAGPRAIRAGLRFGAQ